MKRKAIASFLLVVLFLVSVFPMNISTGAVDSANDLRFTSERTSLNNERIDRQAKIVEHRITTSELEKMKREIGVYEKGRDYNQIINGHGTGLRPPTEEEWAQIAAKANVVETISLGLGSEPVFSRVDWSTSPWFPPIGDQDGEGSCVSWAVGYYTKTFQEAIEHGWNLTGAQWEGAYPTPAYQDKIISPAFIYHLTNFGLNRGTWTPDAINLVCSIGACSWAEMPWDSSDQATWPSENAWWEAAYYRGASTGLEVLSVDTADGILSLKNLIASGNLALIGVNASQLSPLTSEDVWTVDNYNPGGTNHRNTVVGYDDNMTYLEGGSWSKGAFKIANSWGVGVWENVSDGCYWISYKAMSQRVESVMFYRDRIGYVPALTCSFRIEHPVRGDCDIAIGMGTHDHPYVLKITDYICGGNFSFCPNNIVLDITEFMDAVPNVYGQPFFIRVYDRGIDDPLGGTSATGTILYFAVENTVSSNPPVTTVNDGYVFTDLILGAYIDWWPMFHHDLSHTGYSTSTAPNTNTVLWSSQLSTSPNVLRSGPTISDGKVFVGSWDKKVYALNASTGAYIWSYPTGDLIEFSSPAVAYGLVFVGSQDNNVYALNATTGDFVWKYTTGYWVWSSPTISDGKVFVASGDGNVYCLNATNSALIWKFPMTPGWSWSSPAVSEGKVFVGSMDHKVYALNATNGAFIWSYDTGNYVFSSPAVADGKVFVGSHYRGVFALNATTGAFIWNYVTGPGRIYSSPAVMDGIVYIGSEDKNLYALNAANGTLIWIYATGDWVWSSPAVADGKVFVGSWDKKVYALNATTGVPIWSYTTGGSVCSSPAVADGKVFIGSNDGKIYAFGVHDVAVTNVTSSKTVVCQGYSLNINVTAANHGGYTETFNVTVYVNTTSIATQTVTLRSISSTTITFTWNTSGFVKGNYTIKAYAWPVLGETDTLDNTFPNGMILVTISGDINGDTYVNAKDAVLLGVAFNSKKGDPSYNPNADINDDDWVNAKDAIILGKNFNEHW